ncbi:MAG: hypothetical protein QOE94_831 [Mycobacterium sp.]|nr:hypothetical protein [Mycobacterium sp.]
MSIPHYGDYQFDIYFDGLEGQLPKCPSISPRWALLRADSPEKADEALALIYGPGRHTAVVWGPHSS